MRPTDHMQMVTSWCELTLRCVDRVGISEMPGKTVRHSRYFYVTIISTRPWAWRRQLLTDWLYSYRSTFYPRLGDNIRLRQTVADCCKVWHFSRYISLAIWIHSELLSLVSMVPRLYECSYMYSIQGEYEVTSSPGSEHSRLLYAHDLWSYYSSPCSRARLPLCVTCCLPPDFLLLSLYYKGCSL